MIFITGDTHGEKDFEKLIRLAESEPSLTKNDYVLIAGDFGAVWSESTLNAYLKPYEALPFTVLFIDGNHENFEMLNSYPLSEWKGGKVHFIKPSIIHLTRGQIFEIEGKTFFTFGGATSVDKYFRKAYVSWWPEEVPSDEELQEAFRNLKKAGDKVDFIVTHTIDERALYYPLLKNNVFELRAFIDNAMLSNFEETVDYGHWYFGHYHVDGDITDKKTALYQNVIRIV